MKKIIGLNIYFFNLGVDDLYLFYDKLIHICTQDFINDILRFYNNKHKRYLRSYKYLCYLLNNFDDCIFATFTINEENYPIDPKKFRDRIIYLLNKKGYKYYGNLDIGKKGERLHAHIVINSRLDIHTFGYKLGTINFKLINRNDPKAIGKYINKLTNHAIKQTVYGRRFTNVKIVYGNSFSA